MNIIINQKRLFSAVKILERIVSRNVSLPILGTILLKTNEEHLILSATNLEIGINYKVGAKIENGGEIAVPARVFFDFISNITDEKITLNANKNILVINSEHHKTQILSMEAKDFPIIPKIKKEALFKINSQVLKNSLVSVFDSVSFSETRPELGGIYVNISNDQINFVATDSFRLSEKTIFLKNNINKSFIIPRNTAAEIVRILENLDKEVVFVVSENQLFIYDDDFELVSRLVDGHYPDYKKVIPDKFLSLAKINKNGFEKNIRTASVFSSNISDIKIKANKNLMKIFAKNSDRGEIESTIFCELKNKPFEISVNYHYLLDGLKVIPTENIIIEFTGEGSPLVLKGEDKKDQIYVIMPLRS